MTAPIRLYRANFDAESIARRRETSHLERHEYGELTRVPSVSIIVPTRDRHRRGLLDQLLRDLREQSFERFEVLLVIGDSRQGRAINRGVDEARGEFIVTMDDDTKIGTPKLLENLVATLRRNPDVGMVGASTVLPPGCGRFQKIASEQIPRRLFPIVSELTDSDMVQHPCLALRKSLFVEIGGEDEELIRGLDPILRYKVRQAGYRVAIAPHTYISHLLPDTLWSVVRMYFRNGKGSAFAQRHFPQRVLALSDGHQRNQFPPRVPFLRRVLSYPVRIGLAAVRWRWIRVATELSYSLGFVREFTSPSRK